MHEPGRDRERGAGVLSMAMGTVMFLIMLVFAVNLLFNLYTTSVVSSLAIEAARDVAEFDGSPDNTAAIAAAEADFRSRVSGATDFEIVVTGGNVVASIKWESNSLFPAFGDGRAFGTIDRTFTVRVEEQQAP